MDYYTISVSDREILREVAKKQLEFANKEENKSEQPNGYSLLFELTQQFRTFAVLLLLVSNRN